MRLTEIYKSIINEYEKFESDSFDLDDFILKWYKGEDGVFNLTYLNKLIQAWPEYYYEGEAFRITDKNGNDPYYIKPPVSWSKTLEGTKKYLSIIDTPDENHVVIKADVKGIDLVKLVRGSYSSFKDDITDAEEVVSLKRPTNVKILYKIDQDTRELIPYR